jgi:hypothetical protein
VTFSIDPTTEYEHYTLPGDATFSLSDVVVDNAAATLGVNGGTVMLAATLKDPNLGTTLESISGKELIQSAEGLKVTFTPASPAEKIDVAQNGKFFTPSTGTRRLFEAGSIKLQADATLKQLDGSKPLNDTYMKSLLGKQTFTLSGVNLAPFTKSSTGDAYISLETACTGTATPLR